MGSSSVLNVADDDDDVLALDLMSLEPSPWLQNRLNGVPIEEKRNNTWCVRVPQYQHAEERCCGLWLYYTHAASLANQTISGTYRWHVHPLNRAMYIKDSTYLVCFQTSTVKARLTGKFENSGAFTSPPVFLGKSHD